MAAETSFHLTPKGRFEQLKQAGMEDQEALLMTLNWMFEKIDKLEKQMEPLAEQFLTEEPPEEE